MDVSTITAIDKRRFMQFVQKKAGSDCWYWTGAVNGNRIPMFSLHGHTEHAHRFAYAAWHGAIPAKHLVVSTCPHVNSLCVNPDHHECRSMSAHLKTFPGSRANQTHCKRNHAFTPANTRRNKSGSRVCLICERNRYISKAKRHALALAS